VLLGLFLSLVTVVVSVVSSASSDGPAQRYSEQAYLDRIRPFVERSSEQGAALVRARSQGLRLGRDGVQRQLGRVTQDAQAVLADVQGVDPPESMSTARSILVTTMVIRARAAAAAQEGFKQAYAGGPPGPPAELLAWAGEEAAVGGPHLRGLPRVAACRRGRPGGDHAGLEMDDGHQVVGSNRADRVRRGGAGQRQPDARP